MNKDQAERMNGKTVTVYLNGGHKFEGRLTLEENGEQLVLTTSKETFMVGRNEVIAHSYKAS